jgi:hypothetical protein
MTSHAVAQPENHLSDMKCSKSAECVWFCENLDTALVKQARRTIAGCDLSLIVGTYSVVRPAAGMEMKRCPTLSSKPTRIRVRIEPCHVSVVNNGDKGSVGCGEKYFGEVKREISMETSWYFTAPWNPVSVRRGDALGFRAAADHFSELLAPGLTNLTSDARWISILSWCLKWSHIAWENADGDDLTRRYAWLRPLELLWIDRALESGQTTRQLRGRRSIERWRNVDRQPPYFAMSPDQFRRYRQLGMYGAYRIVLRTVPGLTTGDGWTLDSLGLQLADLVNKRLQGAQLDQKRFENVKRNVWRDKEARFWVTKGWEEWLNLTGNAFLPTERGDNRPLPEDERNLVAPKLFGEDDVRQIIAKELAKAKDAKSHLGLCKALAHSKALAKKIHPESLALLPAFTHFADVAMDAMRELLGEINSNEENPNPAVEKLARSTNLQKRLDRLCKAGDAWLNEPGRSAFRHEQAVTCLAQSMHDAGETPAGRLRALISHHHGHGGGRRWFCVQNGKVVLLVSDKGITATNYRFRLRSLSRLAAQCGVANMNRVLGILEEQSSDEEEDE